MARGSKRRKRVGRNIVVKDEDGKYHYIPPDSIEIVTTLIRKYKDENGMGWTQYTVKIKSKKRG